MNQHTALNAKLVLEKVVADKHFTATVREKADGNWCVDIAIGDQTMPGWDAGGVVNFLAGFLKSKSAA